MPYNFSLLKCLFDTLNVLYEINVKCIGFLQIIFNKTNLFIKNTLIQRLGTERVTF